MTPPTAGEIDAARFKSASWDLFGNGGGGAPLALRADGVGKDDLRVHDAPALAALMGKADVAIAIAANVEAPAGDFFGDATDVTVE